MVLDRYRNVLFGAIALLVALMVAMKPSASLALAVLLWAGFVVIKKPKLVYEVATIALLAVPFGNAKFFNLYVPQLKTDLLTVVLVLLTGVVGAKMFLNRSLRDAKPNLSFAFWIMVLIAFNALGYANHNPYLTSEMKVYLLYAVYILSAYFMNETFEQHFKQVMRIAVIGSLVLAVLVIFMYFFKFTFFNDIYSGSFYQYDTRVAVGNQAIFILTVPLMIAAMNMKQFTKSYKLLMFITAALAITSVIMSESRMFITGTLVNTIVVFLVSSLKFEKSKASERGLKVFGILALLMLSLVLINLISPIMQNAKIATVLSRFSEVTNGSVSSLSTREVTNTYNLKLVEQNLLGHGVGSPMNMYDGYHRLVVVDYFIDNGFIVLLYKFGIIGFLIFAAFYWNHIAKMVRSYRISRDSLQGQVALVILICLPLFFINGFYFTTQLIKNGAVFGFLLILFALFAKEGIKSKSLK